MLNFMFCVSGCDAVQFGAELATCFSRDLLFGLEDERDVFLRNVG
jgi:hypothetical protein